MNTQRLFLALALLIGVGFPCFSLAQCTSPIIFTGGPWDYANWGGTSIQDPVQCDVTVPSGANALLQDETIYFDPQVEITVELGATFMMQRCTLQSADQWGFLNWGGIYAEGDPNLSPFASGQTRIFMRQNAIYYAPVTLYYGPVLTCEDNRFEGRGCRIIYMFYDQFPAAVKIRRNVFFRRENGAGLFLFIDPFVDIRSAFNVVVEDNYFSSAALPESFVPDPGLYDGSRGAGIFVSNGGVLARGNTFEKLAEGLRIGVAPGIFTPLVHLLNNGNQIWSNSFQNCQVGVWLNGEAVIQGNEFRVDEGNKSVTNLSSPGSAGRLFIGVRVDAAGNATTVRDNQFEFEETVEDAWAGNPLHVVGIKAGLGHLELIHNDFSFDFPAPSPFPIPTTSYIQTGIWSTQGNADIDIRCNRFDHDMDWTASSTSLLLDNQNQFLEIGSATTAAGNEFPACQGSYLSIALSGTAPVQYFEAVGSGELDLGCVTGPVALSSSAPAASCGNAPFPTLLPNSIPPTQYPAASKSALGVSETAFSLFPNPLAGNVLQVEVPEIGGTLRMVELTGRLLWTQEVSMLREQIVLPELSAGVYLVEYRWKGGKRVERLVVE